MVPSISGLKNIIADLKKENESLQKLLKDTSKTSKRLRNQVDHLKRTRNKQKESNYKKGSKFSQSSDTKDDASKVNYINFFQEKKIN